MEFVNEKIHIHLELPPPKGKGFLFPLNINGRYFIHSPELIEINL